MPGTERDTCAATSAPPVGPQRVARYTVDVQGEKTDYLAWAEHYVNQLDPLHPEQRNPDFAHERSFQYNEDEKRFAEELQRLLGHTWEHAAKLS